MRKPMLTYSCQTINRSRSEIGRDSNFDGKIDIAVYDTDRDGKWDISFHDADFDGTIDLVGYHPDGEITPSSYETYKAYVARLNLARR